MKKAFLAFLVLVAVLVVSVRAVNFSSGVILGEPDEEVHVQILAGLKNSFNPVYQGIGFYYEMPLYFWTAALFNNFVFHRAIFSLRWVSFISTILTALILSFYFLKKEGRFLALLAPILYLLIPLSVFYARVGIIEPFLVLLITGGVVFYDLSREKRDIRLSAFSGIFLGLSLLTKYTGLPILAILTIYLLLETLTNNRRLIDGSSIKVNLQALLPLVVASLIFLPVFLYFYKLDSFDVRWQTKQIFGLFGGVRQEFQPGRILNFPWWFSWPIILLTLAGLGRSVREYRKYGLFVLFFLAMLVSVLSRLPFYPRYGLVLCPFLVVFAVLGVSFIKSIRLTVGLVFLVLVLNVLPIIKAWHAADWHIIEEAVSRVKLEAPSVSWSFSNYWPNYFGAELGVKNYAWLTYDGPDMESFAPGEKRNALAILKTDGGAVFLENLYADLYLTQQPGRLRAINEVRKNYQPAFSVTRQGSNFPFSQISNDRIDVYLFSKNSQ
ncbi:MAG: glycosyltransferase family 39 protein [Patescibacteria group bacterium]|nr:glycosyltransferase family 39 protein [Patescibacteria group bacterium]